MKRHAHTTPHTTQLHTFQIDPVAAFVDKACGPKSIDRGGVWVKVSRLTQPISFDAVESEDLCDPSRSLRALREMQTFSRKGREVRKGSQSDGLKGARASQTRGSLARGPTNAPPS